MPMIPLSFVLVLVMGYFLLVELALPTPRNRFACAFLLLVMFQLIMVGLRFGYGIAVFGIVYPFTAALLGPLAFLSFRNPADLGPKRLSKMTIHLLPLATAVILGVFAQDYIDLAQGVFTLIYAAALALLGLNERDTFPWVDFNRREYVRHALWCVVALMLVSATTDLVIAFDTWRSQGANITVIVGWTSIVAVGLFVPYLVWQKISDREPRPRSRPGPPQGDPEAETALLNRIERMFETTQLHLDPNLNLNRVARKLGVPARQVSAAINRQRSISVSQLINDLRIDEACRLLRNTDLTVAGVMLQSGFTTKSNFNREFGRRLGTSPSAWRQAK